MSSKTWKGVEASGSSSSTTPNCLHLRDRGRGAED